MTEKKVREHTMRLHKQLAEQKMVLSSDYFSRKIGRQGTNDSGS